MSGKDIESRRQAAELSGLRNKLRDLEEVNHSLRMDNARLKRSNKELEGTFEKIREVLYPPDY